MIEEGAQQWTEQDARVLNAYLSSKPGQRWLAIMRYRARAVPLNLPLQPGIDFLQVNALVNRDRESKTQQLDEIVKMSEVKEKKEPPPSSIRQLIRDPDKEPQVQPRKKR